MKIRWNEKELADIVKFMPVNVIKDELRFAQYAKVKGYNADEVSAIMTCILYAMPNMRDVKISSDSSISFGEMLEYYERATVQFIVIHRVNYLLHSSMLSVYDILDRQRKLRFQAKKLYQKAENIWKNYVEPRERKTEKTAWYTLQDHFSVMEEMLSPYNEALYSALRDYLIYLGWKDIELKSKIEIVFLLNKVAFYSFRAFFNDFKNGCGCDFSACFRANELSMMTKYFTDMLNVLGMETENDSHGLVDLKGLSDMSNNRVKSAWDTYMKNLQSEDLMDNAALKAIKLNPDVEKNYKHLIEESEQKKIDDGIEELSKKYKVSKIK